MTICAKCEDATSTTRDGKFLHVRCFNAWWQAEYGDTRGPYYRWMRGGMCVR